MKKELANEVAAALASYGFDVYLSKDGSYGFYTDGERVVSFGCPWDFSVDYSGKYNSTRPGDGWMIARDLGVITEEQAKQFISDPAPSWAVGNNSFTYTNPKQYLKTYGRSSAYTKFEPELEVKDGTHNEE